MAKRVSSLNSRKRVRRFFGHLSEVAQMPNLIEVQRSSYDQFLQLGVAKQDRQNTGLQESFASVFPIHDFAGRAILEFHSYELE
ncbi:MAG: DNA-directed RNA polymerase subunit beta, partial [Candidatus Puniceispirillaceae bacterium]